MASFSDKKVTTIHWTDESFKLKIDELYNGNVTVLESYNGIDNKILFHCKKHNCDWLSRPTTLLHVKCNCPQCLKEEKNDRKNINLIESVRLYNPEISLLEEYSGNNRIYVKCNDCGHRWYANIYHLTNPKCLKGCPVCSSNVVVRGINDIATTHPHLVKFFKNTTDAFKYSYKSNKKVSLICPDCKEERTMHIFQLSSSGFKCHKCSDSISYPNKYCRAFLSQLPIETIEHEWSPNWANGMLYDNYFEYENQKYVLEADGMFHYENRFSDKELNETKKRDSLKEELAKQNGIILIRIDCKKSDSNYISQNILDSKISSIFDLKNIDWDACDVYGNKNILKDICMYFSEHNTLSVDELSKKYKLSQNTIRKYLKIGTKIGWCTYNSHIGMLNSKSNTRRYNLHKITVMDETGKEMYHFRTPTLCSRYMSEWYDKKFDAHHIIEVCDEKRKTHQGFKYKYYDNDNMNIDYITINNTNRKGE